MTKPKLTILTDPVPAGREFFTEHTRRLARRLKYSLQERAYSSHAYYRGHFAVTRSLVEGLEKIGASFNYNPSRFNEVAETVHVVSGVRALRQMIRLKQQRQIKKLFTGPNIVVFSTEADSILASPEIDGVINHCDFACEFWAVDHPELLDRCFRWPAGIDTSYWRPDPAATRDRILIFEKLKEGSADPTARYAEYLLGLGWKVEVIKYGCYTHAQYLQMLQRSRLMLGFSPSESQGIAWAEAWSADVPTLVWKNTSNIYHGRQFHCSTAPYLRPQNGLFFDDLEDFKAQLCYWESHQDQFTPRAWVLENMSDEVCASMLYQKITGC